MEPSFPEDNRAPQLGIDSESRGDLVGLMRVQDAKHIFAGEYAELLGVIGNHCSRHLLSECNPRLDEDHAATDTDAGLVRAGDLIGQLGDPLYPRKLNALFHEFAETGVHEKLDYASPADLVDHYPQFYWSKIERYIGDALRYLEMTMEGKLWIATLYSHIFAIEHNRRRVGPQPGPA